MNETSGSLNFLSECQFPLPETPMGHLRNGRQFTLTKENELTMR